MKTDFQKSPNFLISCVSIDEHKTIPSSATANKQSRRWNMTHLNSKNVMIKALIDQKKDLILKNKAPNEPDILVYDGIVDEVCFEKQK